MEYKDPADVLTFTAVFTNELGGASITGRTVTVGAGLTKDSDALNGTDKVDIVLSGGTAGNTYKVTVNVVTNGGETFEKNFYVRVRNQFIG